MEVIIDGDSNFSFQGTPEDVFDAVAVIAASLQERGRSILAVKTDGRSIDSTHVVELLKDKPLGEVGKLEITTEDTGKLVAECLDMLEAAVPQLPTACHELAAVFQGNKAEEGFEPFHRLAEAWELVKSRQLLVASALGLDLEHMAIDSANAASHHADLNRYLGEAADAIQAGDLVLLGDLLEYELAPRAETETKIVALLREHSKPQAS